MKLIHLTISIFLALGVSLILFYGSRTASSAEGENYCFTCHTNARKLIQITREIAEARGPKAKASSEVKGEG